MHEDLILVIKWNARSKNVLTENNLIIEWNTSLICWISHLFDLYFIGLHFNNKGDFYSNNKGDFHSNNKGDIHYPTYFLIQTNKKIGSSLSNSQQPSFANQLLLSHEFDPH